MKEKEFKSWSRLRQLGKGKYTLLLVLYFIVLINVSIGVCGLLRGKFLFDIESIIMNSVAGVVSGIFTGRFTWRIYEARYRNYINEKNRNDFSE